MTGTAGGPVKGVVLDLDGTLADTPDAIAVILVKILADRNVYLPEATARIFVGRPLEQSVAQLMSLPPGHPEVEAVARDYHTLFREYVQSNIDRLSYPGVPDGLTRLREDGRLLAVATSKPQRAAERILQLMRISAAFDVVAGDDTVARGKPHPDMALFIASRLGLEPAECVVVGDGVADMAMGRAAGMRSIGVSYGVATTAELIAAGAEQVADSFGDLVAMIGAGRRIGLS